VNAPREHARAAYRLAERQLASLRDNDFDAFDAGSGELEDAYSALLQADPATFDDETRALTREIVHVQRSITHELDRLMDQASEAMALQRRRHAVSSAYNAAANQPGAPRTA
jgi:NAD-dependent oxidoreductase involved in siderophore biosynthesis